MKLFSKFEPSKLDSNYFFYIVIGSHFLKKTSFFKSLIKYFEQNYFNFLIISNLSSQIECSDINNAYKKINRKLTKVCFLSIGGGGTIDAAKFLKIMLKDNNSNVWKYFNKKIKYQSNKTNKNIKHYVIPTTSGSGSESTQYAVIFNAEIEIKKAISNQYLICDKIFYENSLLATMNREITINSSFDALGQAVESLLSKKRNSLSDKYAIQTLKLIFEFLPKVLNDITNPNYRKKLFVSSILSGKAISITETNFCHAICDTLGPYTNNNHGKLVGYFTSITLNFFKKNFKSYNKPINKINFIAKKYNFISINSFIHKYNQCEMINIKNVLLRYKMSKTIYKVGSMKNCLCYISKYQIMRLLSEC